MNPHLQPLKKEETELFHKEDRGAFHVHARYFPGDIASGAAKEDRREYELTKMIDNRKFTVLSVRGGERGVGGAIVENMDNRVSEIAIFFLTVEYQSNGIGKTVPDMVEACSPNTKVFHLIIPSPVVRIPVFCVNKCDYHIVKGVNFDRRHNTADYLFEKKNNHWHGLSEYLAEGATKNE